MLSVRRPMSAITLVATRARCINYNDGEILAEDFGRHESTEHSCYRARSSHSSIWIIGERADTTSPLPNRLRALAPMGEMTCIHRIKRLAREALRRLLRFRHRGEELKGLTVIGETQRLLQLSTYVNAEQRDPRLHSKAATGGAHGIDDEMVPWQTLVSRFKG